MLLMSRPFVAIPSARMLLLHGPASKSPLVEKGFLGAEYSRMIPMIEQDKQSWNKGRAEAMRGAPSKCPKGLDKLSCSSGYIEGAARRAKRPLRVIASPMPSAPRLRR
jgi:hypothetical protein